MLNELLLNLARWLDSQSWSTAIHESIYLYAWIETTHVHHPHGVSGHAVRNRSAHARRDLSKSARLDYRPAIGQAHDDWFCLMLITGILAVLRHSRAHHPKPMVSHQGRSTVNCRRH